MADTTTAGRRRTDLALSIARDCDFEATGQLPVPYMPRRHIAKKVLKGTGKIAGKGTVLAAKGAWGATKWVFSPSRSSRTVTVIVTDEQCGVDGVVGALILIVVALGLVGILAGGA